MGQRQQEGIPERVVHAEDAVARRRRLDDGIAHGLLQPALRPPAQAEEAEAWAAEGHVQGDGTLRRDGRAERALRDPGAAEVRHLDRAAQRAFLLRVVAGPQAAAGGGRRVGEDVARRVHLDERLHLRARPIGRRLAAGLELDGIHPERALGQLPSAQVQPDEAAGVVPLRGEGELHADPVRADGERPRAPAAVRLLEDDADRRARPIGHHVGREGVGLPALDGHPALVAEQDRPDRLRHRVVVVEVEHPRRAVGDRQLPGRLAMVGTRRVPLPDAVEQARAPGGALAAPAAPAGSAALEAAVGHGIRHAIERQLGMPPAAWLNGRLQGDVADVEAARAAEPYLQAAGVGRQVTGGLEGGLELLPARADREGAVEADVAPDAGVREGDVDGAALHALRAHPEAEPVPPPLRDAHAPDLRQHHVRVRRAGHEVRTLQPRDAAALGVGLDGQRLHDVRAAGGLPAVGPAVRRLPEGAVVDERLRRRRPGRQRRDGQQQGRQHPRRSRHVPSPIRPGCSRAGRRRSGRRRPPGPRPPRTRWPCSRRSRRPASCGPRGGSRPSRAPRPAAR